VQAKQVKSIMIVAGEASGDAHAAKLVRALIEAEPDGNFEFFGAAGPNMREAGVEPVVRSDGLAIVGLLEIAAALPMFISALRDLRKAAVERRPDVVVLVDFPDFNLRLARSLKKLGFKLAYYISPQLWAWRKHRVRAVKKYVDLMLTILPFEREWYARHGVANVEYVGSPLAREVNVTMSREDFCVKHGLDPERPVISFLPGSRSKEIVRILPVMLDAAAEVASRRVEVQFVIALATKGDAMLAKELVARRDVSLADTIVITAAETYDALGASDAAAVTSGTATLEAGLLHTPMAIVYKTSALNYLLFEPMIDVEHFGLINLIAEKRVAKELIQKDFIGSSLAEELLRLLRPDVNSRVRSELQAAADKLAHGGASGRAAEAILKVVSSTL
jgi:lipid-A-disaccharide synthase